MTSVLNETNRAYIKSLIPENIPDWKKSWQEGYEIGKDITIPRTPFMDKHGVHDEIEYRMKMAEQGKITWQVNMGLGSVEEEVEGLKQLQKFNEETGLNISFCHQLPRNIVGTPKAMREGIPTALGFMLEEPDDWKKIANASNIQPIFADNHIGYPNAVYTTKCCLEAGCRYQGLFGTFTQVAPGCPDEIWNMNENIKALGMCAAKYDDKVIVTSNTDDAIPAYFVDLASTLAWAKWERYVVTDLCKCRYAMSYGNATSNLIHKVAMWLAASDTFKKEDQPGIEFLYPNTVDHWDHHIHSNYGFQIPEALIINLAERKYHTGASFLAVPITEKITIPTVEEMLDMNGAIQRTDECAEQWEKLMDWTVIEETRDMIKSFSDEMFNNILTGLTEAGVDITDPIEMMVVFKKMDPTKWEKMFHPSTTHGNGDTIEPVLPTALWTISQKQIVDIYENVKNRESAERIKGMRIIVASGDVHYAAIQVIYGVLEKLGADVVYGGDSLEAYDVLDLAEENECTNICISLHNGQALPYSQLLVKLAEERGGGYRIFEGGAITSFLNEGDKEPSDVTEQVMDLGIVVTQTVEELVEKLAQ